MDECENCDKFERRIYELEAEIEKLRFEIQQLETANKFLALAVKLRKEREW